MRYKSELLTRQDISFFILKAQLECQCWQFETPALTDCRIVLFYDFNIIMYWRRIKIRPKRPAKLLCPSMFPSRSSTRHKYLRGKKKGKQGQCPKIELEFSIDVQSGASYYWFTVACTPTERALVSWAAHQLVTMDAQASSELESEQQSSLFTTIAMLRFPPLDPLPVGAWFEKAVVYCIHGSWMCCKCALLIVFWPAVSEQAHLVTLRYREVLTPTQKCRLR
jgi:hypothetical protein